jgi:hypothetical protein
MRKLDDMYEYVTVYFDNLVIATKNAKDFVDILEKEHKVKTKGAGPISFHLGMDFSCNEDKTLCLSSTKYIE